MSNDGDSPERYRMIADRLACETGDTTENVIRKALALYWRALRANEAGQRLAILDADDVIVAEITNLTQPLPDDPTRGRGRDPGDTENGGGAMKVWVTTYALTKGIIEVDGETSDISENMLKYNHDGCSCFAHGGGTDWHQTQEAAIKKAEAMRVAKIASMRKTIARLEAISFSTEEQR